MALKDYHLIEDLRPVGGAWYYTQVWEGHDVRIPFSGSAKSARDLVEQVRDFRIKQGIELGDIEFDVATFVKRYSPQNDRFKGRNIGQPKIREIEPMIYQLRAWVNSIAEQKPRLIIRQEAMERADICAKCPLNIKWETKCGDCNDEVNFASQCVRKIPSTAMDGVLKACRAHKIHLLSAVFLDQDFLPKRSESAPDTCWLPK